MASGECELISDCFNGTGVARVCYDEASFSNETFFCDCSNWFGWTGEDCDQESPQLSYYRASLIVIAIWGLVAAIFNSRTLYYHISAKIHQKTDFNPAFYTGIFVWLGCFLLSMNAFIQLPAAFDSSRFEIATYKDFSGEIVEDLAVKGGKLGVYFQIFASVFFFFASIQIVHSWSNVILITSNFYPKLFILPETTLLKLKKGYLITFSLILVIFLVLDVLITWVLMIAISSLIATAAYWLGYNRFITALRVLDCDGEQAASIKIVRISAQINTICLTINGLFFTMYLYTFTDFRETLVPGEFNHVLFLRDLATIMTLIMFSFNSWYLHKVTSRILKMNNLCSFSFGFASASSSTVLMQTNADLTSLGVKDASNSLQPTELGPEHLI